jgi:hypothetical protein
MEKDKMQRKQLTKYFWEYQLSEEELQECLSKNDLNDPLTVSLYKRILLSTPNWYDVLRLLTPSQLKNALSQKVLSTIQSAALQERFSFAASRLFPSQ